MSILRVNQIQSQSESGQITVGANTNISGSAGSFVAPRSVLQVRETSTMPTAHISVTSTSEVSVPLIANITPLYVNSRIKVEFYSQMMYGAANALVLVLYRRINGGSWTNLTPVTGTSARYQYGWSYNNSQWGPFQNIYFDSPGTTGYVEYVVNYRNWSSTSTNYVVHQYQEYGYMLTEIAA